MKMKKDNKKRNYKNLKKLFKKNRQKEDMDILKLQDKYSNFCDLIYDLLEEKIKKLDYVDYSTYVVIKISELFECADGKMITVDMLSKSLCDQIASQLRKRKIPVFSYKSLLDIPSSFQFTIWK